MALLEHEALLVAGEVNAGGSLLADPKDEMFLACVLDGQADLIVSGNPPYFNPNCARSASAPAGQFAQSYDEGRVSPRETACSRLSLLPACQSA